MGKLTAGNSQKASAIGERDRSPVSTKDVGLVIEPKIVTMLAGSKQNLCILGKQIATVASRQLQSAISILS